MNNINVSSWTRGKLKGLADNQDHPLCYIIVTNLVTLPRKQSDTTYNIHHPWIGCYNSNLFVVLNLFVGQCDVGNRFNFGEEANSSHALGFRKSIRPTRTTYSGKNFTYDYEY